MVSPSQWPKDLRVSTVAGRWSMSTRGNEMDTGVRGSRSRPLVELPQEQAHPVVVAGLDFAAEQFIDRWDGQFHLGIPGAMSDDVGALVCKEAVINVIEVPPRNFVQRSLDAI